MTTMADNKDKKVLNVPHLRFPEFSGEWEKCKLGDIAPLQRGFDLPTHQLEVGTNPVVYSNGIMNYHSSYKCKAPGLVTGRSGTIGKFTFISNGYYWPHNTSLWVTDFNGNIPEFIYYLYQTIKIEQYATGSGVPTLNRNDVHRHKVCVPHTIEQSKIAELFMLLDERIATQNKIIEKLESLIKGITDKLLCNFSWEKVYLRSFMEFYPTNSFSWEQLSYEKGTIRNLHYGLIHGISTKSITTKTLPFISSNKADSRFVCCQNGDVAFADASEDTADIGKAVEFTDVDNTNVVCGLHTIHGRDVKELTIVGFKGFMFNSSYFHEQVRRVAQGTKVFSISANNLSSCYVYIPDKSEQTKITGLLYSMEMKISLSSKLLERYKIQKEYLLRQMFI